MVVILQMFGCRILSNVYHKVSVKCIAIYDLSLLPAFCVGGCSDCHMGVVLQVLTHPYVFTYKEFPVVYKKILKMCNGLSMICSPQLCVNVRTKRFLTIKVANHLTINLQLHISSTLGNYKNQWDPKYKVAPLTYIRCLHL